MLLVCFFNHYNHHYLHAYSFFYLKNASINLFNKILVITFSFADIFQLTDSYRVYSRD